MINTADIDREIAELEEALRAAEVHARETAAAIRMNAANTGLAAADDAAKRVRLLAARLRATRNRALDRLEGNKENAPTVLPPAPSLPPNVRRISEKAKPGEARKSVELGIPLSDEHQLELLSLVRKHFDADAIERIEDELYQAPDDETVRATLTQRRSLTFGFYVNLIGVLALQNAEMRARGEFALRRRREADARFDALEKRIAALEARPTVRYAGLWVADREYQPGEMVTYDGSTWHADVKSKGMVPGKFTANGEKAFTLAVKRGRNGRSEQ